MTRSGSADVAGVAAARPAPPDGLDAAAAAHHRHQSHFQGRERRRGAVQDPGMPGAPPLRARHGRARAVQSRRARKISTRIRPASPKCWRRTLDQHHPGTVRRQHRPHDPPGIRAPGKRRARDRGARDGYAHHSVSGHRPAARHQRDLRHARGRRRHRQRRGVHGEGAAARGAVGAHLRRPAGGADSRIQAWSAAAAIAEQIRAAAAGHRAARRPGRHSKSRCVSGSRR